MKASESLPNNQSTATDCKHAQDPLPFEAQLRATLNVIPAYTWYAVPSGALTFVNERNADYLGIPKDHPLRLGIDTGAEWDSHIPLLHPDEHEKTRRVWSTCLRTGCAGEVTFRVRNAQGGYRWFLSCVEPLRASDGTLLYWVGVNLDIEEVKQAEFYLAEGERLAHMGSWSLRRDGVFDYWSPEIFTIFGFDARNGIPTLRQWLDVLRPVDSDRVHALIRKMFSKGVKGDIQYRVDHPEHGQKTMHSTGDPVFENGVVSRLIGNTLDITEQEELTQELRRREAYLAEAQRLSRTGSFGWKPDTGEIIWSAETYRIFEYDRAITPTIDFVVQRVHPEDRADVQSVIEHAYRGASDFEHAYRLLLPDGRVKHVQVLAHATQDASGNREFVGAVTDITEQRRAEESLRESESYLAEAQKLSHTGSWAWNPNPNRDIRYWSEECYRVLGFDPAGPVPRFEEFFQKIHPDDQAASRERFEKAIRDKADFEFGYRIVHPDKGVRDIHVVGHAVLDRCGDLREFVGTVIDITERKRAEDDLRRAFEDIKALRDELQKENIVLREELGKTSMFEEVIGTSSVLQMVLARAAKVAPTDSTVLIMGETGTGKELIARAIHKRSKRSERPFISVNCAAVPSSLIMSELFGHEKGAFTGAVQRRLGRFELAEGGTIFLDEVGDLPLETQIALLRVLQEREFERVGGTEVLRADVRVISATNRDLQEAIADGAFRSDLYYRLNVFPIKLPPLRERKEDVPLLVNYFVDRYAKRAGKKIKHIQKKALEALQNYSWPGNVRELQNVIERSLIIGETTEFSIDKSWVANEPQQAGTATTDQRANERQRIEAALAQSNGKISGAHGAAAKLGMPPSTLESKIRSLKINKFQFKGV